MVLNINTKDAVEMTISVIYHNVIEHKNYAGIKCNSPGISVFGVSYCFWLFSACITIDKLKFDSFSSANPTYPMN